MIQTPSGPREILLAQAAYIPDFHTNLACLKKFNDKNIWWDNRRNLLYKNDHKIFAYYERHCNQSTLEYNEPRPRKGLQKSLEELDETSDEKDKTLNKQEDISGSRQVDFDGN